MSAHPDDRAEMSATDIHERRSMEQALRRVYEREHRIAETLQRSLLPEKLPVIAGVGLAARYLPAGAGASGRTSTAAAG